MRAVKTGAVDIYRVAVIAYSFDMIFQRIPSAAVCVIAGCARVGPARHAATDIETGRE